MGESLVPVPALVHFSTNEPQVLFGRNGIQQVCAEQNDDVYKVQKTQI